MVIWLRGRIRRSELRAIEQAAVARFRAAPGATCRCDAEGLAADAVAVDALAHVQRAANSYGVDLRITGASPALRELVAAMGLADVLTWG